MLAGSRDQVSAILVLFELGSALLSGSEELVRVFAGLSWEHGGENTPVNISRKVWNVYGIIAPDYA
jgi:hypothetical protein